MVAVAENGETLIEQCAMTQPDVVITGTLTPKMYGSEAAEAVYKSQPKARAMIFASPRVMTPSS